MDERQPPEVERPRRSPAVLVVVSVLAVLALAAALYVIVKSLRRVTPEPIPVALQTAPPDTALVIFRASMRRKVRTLDIRCRTKRKQLAGGLNPEQDSLSRECDSAIASIRTRVTALDSVRRENEKVNAFTRSGLGAGEVSDDSLNAELKKLISE